MFKRICIVLFIGLLIASLLTGCTNNKDKARCTGYKYIRISSGYEESEKNKSDKKAPLVYTMKCYPSK